MQEKEAKRSEAWAEKVCAALALAPCTAAELDQLWAGLWRERGGGLSEERVMGCLLRPQDHTLLLRYCATALRLSRDRLLQDAVHRQGERDRTHTHAEAVDISPFSFFYFFNFS